MGKNLDYFHAIAHVLISIDKGNELRLDKADILVTFDKAVTLVSLIGKCVKNRKRLGM